MEQKIQEYIKYGVQYFFYLFFTLFATKVITEFLKEKRVSQINEQSKTYESLVLHVVEDPFLNVRPVRGRRRPNELLRWDGSVLFIVHNNGQKSLMQAGLNT